MTMKMTTDLGKICQTPVAKNGIEKRCHFGARPLRHTMLLLPLPLRTAVADVAVVVVVALVVGAAVASASTFFLVLAVAMEVATTLEKHIKKPWQKTVSKNDAISEHGPYAT